MLWLATGGCAAATASLMPRLLLVSLLLVLLVLSVCTAAPGIY
jgi:hypothetical protein